MNSFTSYDSFMNDLNGDMQDEKAQFLTIDSSLLATTVEYDGTLFDATFLLSSKQ